MAAATVLVVVGGTLQLVGVSTAAQGIRSSFFTESGDSPTIRAAIEAPRPEGSSTLHLARRRGGTRRSGVEMRDGVSTTDGEPAAIADGARRVSIDGHRAPVQPFVSLATDEPPPAVLRQAEGTVTPIDWDALGDEPLAGVDARAADILGNACKHAMTTWWQDRFGSQPRAELLVLGGAGEHQIRPVAAVALATATALVTGAYDPARTGVGEDVARERTIRMIRSLAAEHHGNIDGGWSGASSWQGALWTALTAQAGWLLWEHLDEDEQRLVHVMVETEADRFVDYDVPYWKDRTGLELHAGDTKAEENSWNSMLLQVATAMIPDHPRWAEWSTKNVELLVSAHARPSDVDNPAMVNGRPVADWIGGWNVEEDGRAYNHARVHPDYMATMVQQLYAATSATLANQPTPAAALHNMPLMYAHFVDHGYRRPEGAPATIYRADGTIYYPDGTDWGTTRRLNFVAVDAVSAAFGVDGEASTGGRHWLEIHGRAALAMQARSPDGRTYLADDHDGYHGREEWVAMHAAWAVLSLWAAQNGNVRISDADPADLLTAE